jgi:magnesium-transporting ATPase (P-type)
MANGRGSDVRDELGDALNVPALCMESPRGLNDPALGALTDVVSRADLIVLIGKHPDFTLRFARPRVASRPFDSRWKYMRVTVMTPDGKRTSYVKGAVEIVLERSSLDQAARRRWLERADAEARRGFKVLGLATGEDDAETELRFLGFVTLWDAPRPEAKRAVEVAQAAGIRVSPSPSELGTTLSALLKG